MWSTSQQDCLNVEPGVSRLTTWKLLIRAFSPEGEGGTRVTSTAWVETWNWEVWVRKAGCWRKLTCPPWQSRHMWDPGLSDSHLWNAPLPQCAEPLSQSRSGLFYIAESRYAAVLACFQAAWWHRRPASPWLRGESPAGVGLARLWLWRRIPHWTLGRWPAPASKAGAWLLSAEGLVIPSGGQ